MGKIIFVTGTDTGVGKTVLTALLLGHLRAEGREALAMKPFCSGSRADARLLRAMQENLLTLDEINPFFFTEPVAPAAARGGPKHVSIDTVVRKIQAVSKRCEVLLVEGSGGLLVPLGKNYTVADLIRESGCPALVVSRNRLGTINHTVLTVKAMQSIGIKELKIVLMEPKKRDISARSNAKMIQKMTPKVPFFSVPNLGRKASSGAIIKRNVKKMKKTLARILGNGNLITVHPLTRGKLINETC